MGAGKGELSYVPSRTNYGLHVCKSNISSEAPSSVVPSAMPSNTCTGVPADIVALSVPIAFAASAFSFVVFRAFAYDPECESDLVCFITLAQIFAP